MLFIALIACASIGFETDAKRVPNCRGLRCPLFCKSAKGIAASASGRVDWLWGSRWLFRDETGKG